MARANGHTLQLLAKRYGRMRSPLLRPSFRYNLPHLAVAAAERLAGRVGRGPAPVGHPRPCAHGDADCVRFVSAEPLLGPIDVGLDHGKPSPDWLIIGGEAGIGARPMALVWRLILFARCRSHYT